MKKIISFMLAVFIVLFVFTACGSNAGGDDTTAETELRGASDLPDYTDEFNLVRENVVFNDRVIADFIALAITAYDSYDGKEFCDFVYEEFDVHTVTAISDAITEEATEILEDDPSSEEFDLSKDLQDFNVKLLGAVTGIAGLNVTYLGTDDADTEAFEEMKEDYAFLIDTISEIVYGEKLITE